MVFYFQVKPAFRSPVLIRIGLQQWKTYSDWLSDYFDLLETLWIPNLPLQIPVPKMCFQASSLASIHTCSPFQFDSIQQILHVPVPITCFPHTCPECTCFSIHIQQSSHKQAHVSLYTCFNNQTTIRCTRIHRFLYAHESIVNTARIHRDHVASCCFMLLRVTSCSFMLHWYLKDRTEGGWVSWIINWRR